MMQSSTAAVRAARWGERSALVGMFAPLALLSSPLVQRMLIAIALLDIPLNIRAHLAWREEDAAIGALGGFEISLTTIGIVLLYLSSFLKRTVETQSERKPLRVSAPLLVWLGAAVVSVFVARDQQLTLFEIFQLFQLMLLYLYLVNWTRTREQVLFVVRWLVIGFILESAIMLVLGFIGRDFGLPGIWFRVDTDRGFGSELWAARVGGTVGAPNGAGAYLAFLMPVVFSLVFTTLPKGYRHLCGIASGLAVAALILTFSRGSWVAFAVSILFLLSLSLKHTPVTRVAVTFVLLIALLAVLGTQNPISDRIFGNDYGTAQGRVPLLIVASRMIADNPILGVGDNNFSVRYDDYITRETRSAWKYAVHNKYLLIWAELGIFGFLAFLWLLFDTLQQGWRGWRANDTVLSPIALGLLAGTLAYMTDILFEPARGRVNTQLLLVVAALVAAISAITAPHAKLRLEKPSQGRVPACHPGTLHRIIEKP